MTGNHWRGFIICQLICLILLVSWLLPTSRAIWDHWDQQIFFALNGSLAPRSTWGTLWALLSFRAMDLLPLFLLAPFLVIPDLLIPRSARAQACMQLLLMLVLLLVFRVLLRQIIEALDYNRISPSRVLQPAVLMRELYPEFNAKDGSSSSFPGDHAAVLMIVSAFLLLQQINRWSVVIVAVAAAFMLPRLFAGAHWFTDVIVGGGLIATQTLAWGYFTPWLARWATALAQRWVPARWQ